MDITPYGTDKEKDALVDSEDYKVRFEAVKQLYGLDKLVYDESTFIRSEVAGRGYGLDVLINDSWY